MSSKYIILSLVICCGLAYDAPSAAKLLDYQLEHTGTGHYFFRFESSDGIVREEEGNVLDENSDESPVIVKGSYSYADETGKVYTVRYTADENGFHPEGDHIPSVPAYILNPNPLNKQIVIAATARPPIPVQYLQTTPRTVAPVQFAQPTPRPQFIQTTPRPQFIQTTPQFLPSEPARFQVNGFSTTPRPEVTIAPARIQVPIEAKRESPKAVPFNELDSKLQSSIVSLLANGDARGFNIAAVNSV